MAVETASPQTTAKAAAGSREQAIAGVVVACRWAMPVVVLLGVLAAAYVPLTERRYDAANGITGALFPRHSAGQSFVARYPNLSGVELHLATYSDKAGPAPASLVLHLRDAPGRGPDIATVRLPAGEMLGANPWYLFSFPPIADSQDRAYYLTVESPDGASGRAISLFSWEPPPESDPYPGGTAYRDGQAEGGDLSFGLRYAPSPLAAWAQVARALSTNMALWLMSGLLLVGAAALCGLALTFKRSNVRTFERYSLVAVLLLAFVNGVGYSLVVPPWQGPDEYAHFAYAALLYKHGLDDGEVERFVADNTIRDDPALLRAIETSMEEHRFTNLIPGYSAPGGRVDASAYALQETRQPPTYYWLAAAAMKTAQMVGLNADPYSNPAGALQIMRVVSVLLSLGVVALAWLAAGLLAPGNRWLRVLLPLGVALLPMHVFTVSMANNDVIAEVAVSALFVTLVALLRWPHGREGGALAGLACLLLVACVATKSTALAAAVPMLAIGLAVWLLRLALSRSVGGPNMRRATVIGALVLLAAVVGVVLLAYTPHGTAAGWIAGYWPSERAPQLQTSAAHEGRYVLHVGGDSAAQVSQVVVRQLMHPAMTLNIAGWARLALPSSSAEGTPYKARIRVREGEQDAASGEAVLDPSGAWAQIKVSARISANSWPVRLLLVADAHGRAVQFDDLRMDVSGMSREWSDTLFRPTLLNPSMEIGAISLRPGVARLLPNEWQQIADVLVNPQTFSKVALWASYADEQYRSFWGLFGWLAVPLPGVMYAVLGLIVVVALASLLLQAVTRRAWGTGEWTGIIAVVTFVVTILIGFARQMEITAAEPIPAYAQGRYLYVLVIPFVWLVLVGLWSAWQRIWRMGKVERQGTRPWGTADWGAWLAANALLGFAGYCLLAIIIPYYYG